jgi:GNAT superfamily N-acetyltransferase
MDVHLDNLRPQYADQLAALQKIALPTLEDSSHLKREHFLKHCELFPEGNFVALVDGKVVGLGSGFLIDFDFDQPQHTFLEMIADGYYTNHQPDGEWYYGADISVHPDYRGRGIGGLLYRTRKDFIKRLNRKGLVAGALLPDFAYHKQKMGIKEYVERVIRGDIHDGTLSFQLHNGFRVEALLKDYIADEPSDNWSALIVWRNPEYVHSSALKARRAHHAQENQRPAATV